MIVFKDSPSHQSELLQILEKTRFNIAMKIGTSAFLIAGGFVRDSLLNVAGLSSELPKDVDIFISNEGVYSQAVKSLLEQGYSIATQRTSSTEMVKEGELTIDIVNMEFSVPYDIIDTFDFTFCCAVYGKGGSLTVSPTFEKDTLNKEIKINLVKLPHHTKNRMEKFLSRGYAISPDIRDQIEAYIEKASWGSEVEKDYNLG